MLSTPNITSPIDIGILEVSPQNRAILSFYIESTGAELFNEVNLDQASAFIIDFDFPGAKESWAELQLANNKPAIILSVNEVSLPNGIWVKKPLSAKALTDAGNKLNEMLNTHAVKPVEMEIEEISSDNLTKKNLNLDMLQTKPVTVENKVATERMVAEKVPALATGGTSTEEFSLNTNTTKISSAPPISKEPTDALTLETQEETTLQPPEIVDIQLANNTQDDATSELDNLLDDLKNESLTLTSEETSTNENNELLLSDIEPLPDIPSEDLLTTENELTSDTSKIILEESIAHPIDNQNNDFVEPQLFNEKIIDPISIEDQPPIKAEQDNLIDTSASIEADTSVDSDDQPEERDNSLETTDIDLEAMLDELQQEMGGSQSPSNPNINNTSYNADGAQQTYQGTKAQERWALLCGDKNIVKSTSDIKKTAFKLKEHLLSSLIETVKEVKTNQQAKRIKYEDLLILIDNKTDSIHCDISLYSEEYAQICFEPIDNQQLKIHSLDESETRMLDMNIKTEPENVYSTEAFIWTTSLLTSRGRLLENTNTSKAVGLKSWPNLTRIESFPHVMNIAAVFSKNPGNLMEVAKWLKIPQCYVFAFYNAALSLNMIDLDTDILRKNNIKKISFNFGSKNKSKNRGLFSRLLNKIKG